MSGRRIPAVTRTLTAFLLLLTMIAAPGHGSAAQAAGQQGPSPSVLSPPASPRPVVVEVRFDLHDINDIDDEAETFEFSGVMTSVWRDPRQAYDPVVDGVSEKIFQGAYQFNEVSPGWYPQIMLVNVAGLYDKSGVLLRVLPDGTSILVETINAIAEVDLDMRRYPFDTQRLEAIFEVLGFDVDEVILEAAAQTGQTRDHEVKVPQWAVGSIDMRQSDRRVSYAGERGVSSSLVIAVDVRRESFYVRRLIVIPLVVIVLLSFSVFWMDRSSLGDRISVSFIGILTGVAYQMVMSQDLPRISYFTLMHGFLNLSFLTMCATVVINLVVGALDKRGQTAAGDRLDRRCRWLFPLGYLGLNGAMLWTALTIW